MAHDVFISHSAKDKTIADAVCASLEARAIRCWIAPRDILPGHDWDTAIITAIKSSKVMVFVFSAHSNDSIQVHREVKAAFSKGITVVPLRLDDVELNEKLEYYMGSVHWLDAITPPIERHLARLADSVAALIGATPEKERTGPATSAERAAATPPGAEGRRAGAVRDDNGLKMELAWCPPGKFTMGSPPTEAGRQDNEAQVAVTLTAGFWLGKTEVTQSQWQLVMRSEPWKGVSYTKEGPNYPATYVDHDGALGFCAKLTAQERQAGRLPPGETYRLPTEAEWEFACRAGTQERFSFGDDESELSDYAWWGGLSGDGNAKTEKYAHAVAQKKPNLWGLYDMHGNVWEWCSDVYGDKLPGGVDPFVDTGGPGRVLRGGGWNGGAAFCRSASRGWIGPSGRSGRLGFRVARSSRK